MHGTLDDQIMNFETVIARGRRLSRPPTASIDLHGAAALPDPGLPIPERAQSPAATELEVDLVGLDKPGRCPERNPRLLVDPPKGLVGWFGRCLEDMRATCATAVAARPEIDRTASVGNMLQCPLLGNETHVTTVALSVPTGDERNGLDRSRRRT